MLKLATWNVNSIRTRLEHIRRWLPDAALDVLAVQETKVQDSEFPEQELADLGYHVVFSGQKAYNGVATLSREPVARIDRSVPGCSDDQRRILGIELPSLYLLNVYVPNGSEVGSDKYAYKLAWLDALKVWVTELTRAFEHVVVLGDFNVTPDDRDVHDPEAWRGRILCSEPERARLAGLIGIGLEDTFRRFEQPPESFSWWDYRGGAYRQNQGLRIDLVLASCALAERCSSCVIDRAPRTWEKPSDHAPVVAEFDL